MQRLSLSLSRSRTHTHTFSLSFTLPLSLVHTRTHTHTHTLSLPLSLSCSLTPTLSTRSLTAGAHRAELGNRHALLARRDPHHLYRGTSLVRPPPRVGPYSSMCLGPYGGPRGGAVSDERGTPAGTPPAPRVRSNRPFRFPWFALELAVIRRPVVQFKRLERDDLVPL